MCNRRGFLKKVGFLAAAVSAPGVLISRQKQPKPDIILFISDDHGWADSGAYGDTYIRTPNIDRLARESMRFTHAFAASPLCSPSRCVIETGLMPHRNGGHKFGTPIDSDIRTMPEYFKAMGYYTAHIGKFHHNPRKRFPYDHVHRSEKKAPAFLSGYDKPKPLFLVVCTHPPHTPWIKNTAYDPKKIKLPPNYVDTPETRSDRANYYSDVTLMDSTLGRVLDAVDKHRDKANTLFVYTSDQGANWPFEKWCVYDGGLRVPLIVRQPGKVNRPGVTDAMVSLADIMPTLIDAAGGEQPKDIDGRSFMSVVRGKTKTHHKAVFGTHTGNDNGGPGIANHCPARTVRTAAHRYILNLEPDRTFTTHISGCRKGSPHHLAFWDSWVRKAKTDPKARKIVQAYQHRAAEELYDIRTDPHEMHNLADSPQHAKLLGSMRKLLAEWCKQQGDTVGRKRLTE
ncbi:MAG: sulfatase [Phycisphaerae bacterium]|jgi:arylsulfatase A-like enzyme|nr:sulfatase [Phycisphaerae bacterium]